VLSIRDITTPDRLAHHHAQRMCVLKELGDCYAAMGRLAAAQDCYREAAALDPACADPLVGLGVVALQLGRPDEAEEAFQAAARRQPRCAEVYGGLAMVRHQRGDFEGAFDMHLKSLELDGDNLVALLGLFQASCQMGTFVRVIGYLELYLERHPGDSSVLFCLAVLYAREGRLADARECLLSVLALEPGKMEAAELLGQVRRQLAEKPESAAVDAVGA